MPVGSRDCLPRREGLPLLLLAGVSPVSPASTAPPNAGALKVLIVDDMPVIHEMLAAVISPFGHHLEFASSGEQALRLYKGAVFDLVLSDIDMAPMNGITLLKQLRAFDPNAAVVIMTAHSTVETAIQSLKFGAFDYLQKPYKVDELMQTLRRCQEMKRLAKAAKEASPGTVSSPSFNFAAYLIGESPKTKRLAAQLQKLAGSSTAILLTGEGGTGHEAVARLLHNGGLTPDGPFVTVDCRHHEPDELQIKLLGQDGAVGAWPQEAAGGTLFLLHPQALPPSVQAGLISVLRKAAGGFRVITATEEDLDAMSAEGRFNEELYYRIAALPITLPSLRERLDDLPLLVQDITRRTPNPHTDSHRIEFTSNAMAALAAYPWPGNIAELQQVVSKAVASSEVRVIEPTQLPERIYEGQECLPLAEFLAMQEKQYLTRVLKRFGGDKARASAAIGVPTDRFG